MEKIIIPTSLDKTGALQDAKELGNSIENEFKKSGKQSGTKFENSFGSEVKNIDDKIPVSKLDDQFSKAGKSAGEKFKTGFGAIAGGAALGSIMANAFSRLTSLIPQMTELAKTQEQAEKRVGAVIKSTGGAAGVSLEEMKKLASSLQDVTNYGDEATLQGQSMLLTFTNIGKDVLPQATETMLNMSTAMGVDLKTTAIQLGKALNDPIKGAAALRRVGVALTQQQIEQIKTFQKSGDIMSAQKVILKELETEFGGLARATADPITQLKNSFGDLQEVVGQAVTDLIRGFGQPLRDALGAVANAISLILKAVQPLFKVMVDLLIPIFNKLISSILPPLTDLFISLVPVIEAIFKAFTPLIDVVLDLSKNVLTILVKVFNELFKVLTPIINAIGNELNEAFKQIAKDILPIFLDLFMGLIPLITDLLKITTPLIVLIIKLAGAITKVTLSMVTWIFNALKPVIGFVTDIVSGISGLVVKVLEFLGIIEKEKKTAPFAKTKKGAEETKTAVTGLNEGLNENEEAIEGVGEAAKKTAPSLDDLKKSYVSLANPLKATFEQIYKLSEAERIQAERLKEVNKQLKEKRELERSHNLTLDEGVNSAEKIILKTKEYKNSLKGITGGLERNKDFTKDLAEEQTKYDESINLAKIESYATILNEGFTTLQKGVEDAFKILASGQKGFLKTLANSAIDSITISLAKAVPIFFEKSIEWLGPILGPITAGVLTGTIYGLGEAAKGKIASIGAEEGTDMFAPLTSHKGKVGAKDTMLMAITPKEARYGILSDKALDVGGRLATNRELAQIMNKGESAEEYIIGKYNQFNDYNIVSTLNGTNRQLQDIKKIQSKIAKRFDSHHAIDINVNDNRRVRVSPSYWRG